VVQRIKKWALANSLAFMGGVEQADENMGLLETLQPVIQAPPVPYPAVSNRLPFYGGDRASSVAAELSHVGVFCSSNEYIVHIKRVDIINVTGASTLVQFSREDNPITGITTQAISPAYIDAGPDLVPVDKAYATDTAAALRGTTWMNGANIPVLDDEIRQIELDVFIQGGVFWVADTTVQRDLFVLFYGEIIPVIQRQPPG